MIHQLAQLATQPQLLLHLKTPAAHIFKMLQLTLMDTLQVLQLRQKFAHVLAAFACDLARGTRVQRRFDAQQLLIEMVDSKPLVIWRSSVAERILWRIKLSAHGITGCSPACDPDGANGVQAIGVL